MAYLNPGEVLAVYSTDQLGRSVGNLTEIVGALREQGIQFKSLTEPLDTTDHEGELLFQIVAAFAQMQQRQVSEKGPRRSRYGEGARAAWWPADGDEPEWVELAKRMRAEGSRTTTSRCC